MARTEQDARIWAGDHADLQFTVVDSTGTAVNITGATISWKCAAAVDSASALFTKTTASGITITNGAAGIFKVSILPADTTALSGVLYHEAQMTLSGAVTTVAVGKLTIEKTLH